MHLFRQKLGTILGFQKVNNTTKLLRFSQTDRQTETCLGKGIGFVDTGIGFADILQRSRHKDFHCSYKKRVGLLLQIIVHAHQKITQYHAQKVTSKK